MSSKDATRWFWVARALLTLFVTLGIALPASATQEHPKKPNAEPEVTELEVIVASKKFSESALLAELYAQLAEGAGAKVERRVNMGNTAIVFEALKQGSVDVYPEYSGTALGVVGLEPGSVPGKQARRVVGERLRKQFGLFWGPPLGFNNTYAIAVRGQLARKRQLTTVSELGELSRRQELRFAFTHEFLARPDGWKPLQKAYDLAGTPKGVEHGMAYQLIESERLDVMEVYATEGLIADHDLVLLKDDKHFFPPYDAAFLYGPRVANSAALLTPLLALAGRLDDATMRRLNRQIEVEGQTAADVAREFLQSTGLSKGAEQHAHGENRKQIGFLDLMWNDRAKLLGHTARHLWLTFLAMLLTVIVGVPLGALAARRASLSGLVLGGAGVVQTIPSLALLVFMVPAVAFIARWTGTSGWVLEGAAIGALFLYGLLPVVRNTKEGLANVDASVVDAATGLGMTPRQVFRNVTLPLALPVILAGIRTAAVIATGSATLAAFIGAGGLGQPIISGLAVQNFAEVWSGAVPAALLAVGIDVSFYFVQRFAAPKL